MTPEESADLVRLQAAARGMTPQQFADAIDVLTPEQVRAYMQRRRDAETICNWMEPRPDIDPIYRIGYGGKSEGGWWRALRIADRLEWWPRELDLDALWKVEERLTNKQWSRYEAEIFQLSRPGTLVSLAIHLSVDQKIRALAATIRAVREELHA